MTKTKNVTAQQALLINLSGNSEPATAVAILRQYNVDAVIIASSTVSNAIVEGCVAAQIPLVHAFGKASAMRQALAKESKVKKFNIGTELRMAFGAAIRSVLANQPTEFDRINLLRATIKVSQKTALSTIQELAGNCVVTVILRTKFCL